MLKNLEKSCNNTTQNTLKDKIIKIPLSLIRFNSAKNTNQTSFDYIKVKFKYTTQNLTEKILPLRIQINK